MRSWGGPYLLGDAEVLAAVSLPEREKKTPGRAVAWFVSN